MSGARSVPAAWRLRARYLISLRALPLRVARFHRRARRHAVAAGDAFSLSSAIRPAELAALLAVANGRDRVVELGTGTGWSAIALALAHTGRKVISYDPVSHPMRQQYLAMVDPAVRARIELREEPDTAGPRPGESVELLFIDSAHYRESVIAAFETWRGALTPGAVVAFHDYGHPHYPGVREAVVTLELAGDEVGGMYVWQAPLDGDAPAALSGPTR